MAFPLSLPRCLPCRPPACDRTHSAALYTVTHSFLPTNEFRLHPPRPFPPRPLPTVVRSASRSLRPLTCALHRPQQQHLTVRRFVRRALPHSLATQASFRNDCGATGLRLCDVRYVNTAIRHRRASNARATVRGQSTPPPALPTLVRSTAVCLAVVVVSSGSFSPLCPWNYIHRLQARAQRRPPSFCASLFVPCCIDNNFLMPVTHAGGSTCTSSSSKHRTLTDPWPTSLTSQAGKRRPRFTRA